MRFPLLGIMNVPESSNIISLGSWSGSKSCPFFVHLNLKNREDQWLNEITPLSVHPLKYENTSISTFSFSNLKWHQILRRGFERCFEMPAGCFWCCFCVYWELFYPWSSPAEFPCWFGADLAQLHCSSRKNSWWRWSTSTRAPWWCSCGRSWRSFPPSLL